MPLLSQVGERSLEDGARVRVGVGDGLSRRLLPPLCMCLGPPARGWRPAGRPGTGRTGAGAGDTGERRDREGLGTNKPSSSTGRGREALPREPVRDPVRDPVRGPIREPVSADEEGFFFFLMSLKRL